MKNNNSTTTPKYTLNNWAATANQSDGDANATITSYSISCVNCRNLHKKCSRELPSCSQCIKRGIKCCYRSRKKRGRPGKSDYSGAGDIDTQPTKLARMDDSDQGSSDDSASEQNTPNSPQVNIGVTEEALVNSICDNSIGAFSSKSTAEDLVTRGAYLALRSLVILHLPLCTSLEFIRTIRERSKSVSPLLGDPFDILSKVSGLTYEQRVSVSQKIMKKAKEYLLNHEVFPLISKSAVVAYALCSFAFVHSRIEEYDEACTYWNCAKVFVNRGLTLLEASYHSLDSLTGQTRATLVVVTNYLLGKLFHDFQTESIKDESSLEKISVRLTRACLSSMLEAGMLEEYPMIRNITHETIGKMKATNSVAKLAHFIQLTDYLSKHIDWSRVGKIVDSHTWTAFLYLLQLSAIVWIEKSSTHDELTSLRMKKMKLRIAKLVADLHTASRESFLAVGPLFLPSILHICDVHIDLYGELQLDPRVTTLMLTELLNFLKTDASYLTDYLNRYTGEQALEKLHVLRLHISLVESKIHQQQQQQSFYHHPMSFSPSPSPICTRNQVLEDFDDPEIAELFSSLLN